MSAMGFMLRSLSELPEERLRVLKAWNLFKPEELTSLSVRVVEVPPHASVPPLRHRHALEVVFVLEGEAEFTVDGETRWGRPGDFLHMPPMAVHSLRTGDRGVRFLAVETPPVEKNHDIEWIGEP